MSQATLKIAGDSQKAQDAIVALEKKIDKLEGKVKSVRNKKPVKPSQLDSLKSYALGFVGVSAAITGAMQAFQAFEKIKDDAARKSRFASAGMAELSQLANTPEEMRALVQEANNAFGQGIGTTKDQAASLIFSLESAGIKGKDRQLFKDLAAKGVVTDSALFARAANTLQKAIGKDETGNFTAILSKAFAASSASPSTAPELLEAAATAGGTASRLKLTDEEILAATAVTATSTGSASLGGTQLQGILTTLEKKGGFEGLSLTEALEKIESMNLKGSDLVKYFGRKEGLAGFDSLLKNMDQFRENIRKIKQAEKEGVVNRKLSLVDAVPEIVAAQSAQREDNQLEISRVDQGTLRNLRNAVVAEAVAQGEEDYGFLGGAYANVTNVASKYNPFFSDRDVLEDKRVQAAIAERDPELLKQILVALKSIDENAKKQKRREFRRDGK